MHSLSVSFLPHLSYDYSEVICRALYDKDPEDWKVKYGTGWGRQIDYSPSTTTGTLRGHIKKWHLLEYIEIALDPQRDWQILVSGIKKALKLGYSLDGLKDIVKQNGNVTISSRTCFTLTIVFFYEYARGRYALNGCVTFSGLACIAFPFPVSRATGSCTRTFPFPSYAFPLT